MRPRFLPHPVEVVKGLKRQAELFRASTHLIQGKVAVVEIEHGVLKALCHDGPGELLESHHEVEYPITEPIRKIAVIIKEEEAI